MKLATRQRHFQARIMAPVVPDASPGLAVYRHGYRQTLRAALADNFPRLADWLGAEAFAPLADSYVAATPSDSWTLAAYGADFAEWIGRVRPDLPVAADLAALDWAARCAFAAADPPLLARSDLPRLDWRRVRLGLAPGAGLVRVGSAAPELWQGEASPVPLRAGRLVLVWRRGFDPDLRVVEGLEAWLLIGIAAGGLFEDICDASAGSAEAIGALLGRWCDDGLLVRPDPADGG